MCRISKIITFLESLGQAGWFDLFESDIQALLIFDPLITLWVILMPLISNCSMMPAWHQLVSMSGHVEESETARKLQLYETSIYQVHSFVCQLDYLGVYSHFFPLRNAMSESAEISRVGLPEPHWQMKFCFRFLILLNFKSYLTSLRFLMLNFTLNILKTVIFFEKFGFESQKCCFLRFSVLYSISVMFFFVVVVFCFRIVENLPLSIAKEGEGVAHAPNWSSLHIKNDGG